MAHIEVFPHNPEVSENHTKRACTFTHTDSRGVKRSRELFYLVPNEIDQIDRTDAEPFLIALILRAMKLGSDLHVYGFVSEGLLENLSEYQAAWSCWIPDLYKKIQIRVHGNKTGRNRTIVRDKRAVAAFSGGIDSMFTVWSHNRKLMDHRSLDIQACVFVHGFDLPLSRTHAYDSAYASARKTLKSIGLLLYPVETNYRQAVSGDWIHACAPALVSTMHFFKPLANRALIGSSEPYTHLIIPWGQNPITDHLLSSDSLEVIHDGAAFSRTEKVRMLANWREGMENLRVCWQNPKDNGNCGWCEKCIRTKLNFLANDLPLPPSLPHAPGAREIRKLALKTQLIRSEFQQILDAARANDVKDEWIYPLERKLGRLQTSAFQRRLHELRIGIKEKLKF